MPAVQCPVSTAHPQKKNWKWILNIVFRAGGLMLTAQLSVSVAGEGLKSEVALGFGFGISPTWSFRVFLFIFCCFIVCRILKWSFGRTNPIMNDQVEETTNLTSKY